MSSAFNKKTIPEQFADKLMADILENKFGAMLPSVRELVVRYGLNIVSIHKGITSLVRRGVLRNNGPRRRLSIIAHPVAKADCVCGSSDAPCCQPLIFLGADPSEINSTLMMATHDIVQACRDKGGVCVTVILSGLSGKARAAAIKAAIIEHKPSHVLLFYCDQEDYDLVVSRSEKVAILGGIITSRKAVRLSADLAMLSVAAFEDLVQLGHRKLRLVKLGREGTPEDKRRLKAFSLDRGVDAQAIYGGELNITSMKRTLESSLKAGVTAFAFPRPEDFVLASAYLEIAGVKVPKDVSVVLLLSGPYDIMQVVKPAHFKIRKEAIISLVLGWFEFGENRSERITRESMRTYVRGLTVGPSSKVN
jgi:hypothetical protein